MNKIKFSHKYKKLEGIEISKPVVLIDMMDIDLCCLSRFFLEYDTLYVEDGISKHYPLKNGRYLLLFFVDKNFRLFTTIRRLTINKEKYYLSNIGYEFEVVIN